MSVDIKVTQGMGDAVKGYIDIIVEDTTLLGNIKQSRDLSTTQRAKIIESYKKRILENISNATTASETFFNAVYETAGIEVQPDTKEPS